MSAAAPSGPTPVQLVLRMFQTTDQGDMFDLGSELREAVTATGKGALSQIATLIKDNKQKMKPGFKGTVSVLTAMVKKDSSPEAEALKTALAEAGKPADSKPAPAKPMPKPSAAGAGVTSSAAAVVTSSGSGGAGSGTALVPFSPAGAATPTSDPSLSGSRRPSVLSRVAAFSPVKDDKDQKTGGNPGSPFARPAAGLMVRAAPGRLQTSNLLTRQLTNAARNLAQSVGATSETINALVRNARVTAAISDGLNTAINDVPDSAIRQVLARESQAGQSARGTGSAAAAAAAIVSAAATGTAAAPAVTAVGPIGTPHVATAPQAGGTVSSPAAGTVLASSANPPVTTPTLTAGSGGVGSVATPTTVAAAAAVAVVAPIGDEQRAEFRLAVEERLRTVLGDIQAGIRGYSVKVIGYDKMGEEDKERCDAQCFYLYGLDRSMGIGQTMNENVFQASEEDFGRYLRMQNGAEQKELVGESSKALELAQQVFEKEMTEEQFRKAREKLCPTLVNMEEALGQLSASTVEDTYVIDRVVEQALNFAHLIDEPSCVLYFGKETCESILKAMLAKQRVSNHFVALTAAYIGGQTVSIGKSTRSYADFKPTK